MDVSGIDVAFIDDDYFACAPSSGGYGEDEFFANYAAKTLPFSRLRPCLSNTQKPTSPCLRVKTTA
eukprot:7316283-Ditylum_brightwellii.AAC.1